MLTKEREEKLINLCRELVKIPSISGKEGNMAEKVKYWMEKAGYDEVIIDKYGSVMGVIKGKREGKKVVLDAHMDTVEVSDENEWIFDPFGSVIQDNRIYGRGTSDMKGPLSAMLLGAAYFAKDNNRDFKGEVYVACPVHEECFEGIAAREISKRVKPDYVIIGEASSLNLKRGQRGRAEIIIETIGKSAHSSNPEIGKNAVYHMMMIIEELKNIKVNEHEILGKGIMELTDIKSSPYPGASVVPNKCRVTYDRRTLVGETKESVLNEIKNVVSRLKEKEPDLNAKVYFEKGIDKCWTGEMIEAERFFPSWLMKEDDELVQKALQGLKNAGLDPQISHYSFCTNGSHYAGEANIPTIGFGPSLESLAHVKDEYIDTEQLFKGCKGYYGIIDKLLK